MSEREGYIDGAIIPPKYFGPALGFTWEDVDLLRSLAHRAESDHDRTGEYADWERQLAAESLADRIAALLQPRP